MRPLRQILLGAAAALVAFHAVAQVPAGYPAGYAETIAGAKKEAKVVIYSTTDTASAGPLIKDFEALYPGISVEYNDMNSTEVYNRFISEKAAGAGSADVLWSSAMDLQIKLANDGGAMTYASPEISHLPTWAIWKDQAFGTTYEPIVIVYNKRLLSGDEIPQSHADLARSYGAIEGRGGFTPRAAGDGRSFGSVRASSRANSGTSSLSSSRRYASVDGCATAQRISASTATVGSDSLAWQSARSNFG